MKEINGTIKFRVRWFGFSEEDDTWEPESSFDDPEIVRRFLHSLNASSVLAGNDVNATS